MCVCDVVCVLPVSKRGYEVEAAVHSVVLDVLPVEAALVSEVVFELLIDVVSDSSPATKNTNTSVNIYVFLLQNKATFKGIVQDFGKYAYALSCRA